MVFVDLVKVGEDRVIMDQVGHSLQKRYSFLGYLDVYLCSIWFVLNGGKIAIAAFVWLICVALVGGKLISSIQDGCLPVV